MFNELQRADINMLVNTQHMVEPNDYGCTPVGGRVRKETDPALMKATVQDRAPQFM